MGESAKEERESFFSIEEELDEGYDEDSPLTWRGPPADTFSDCTLVISNNEVRDYQCTYHVHRAVLGASDKRCLSFMQQSRNNPQKVLIDVKYKDAQDAFPVLLDFVYFGKLDINTENAEILRYLSDSLQCRPLRFAVNKFIERDFSLATCIHYVRETSRYDDKQLLAVAVRESAKLFDQIEANHFVVLKPEQFSAIITSKHFICKDDEKLGKTIIFYLEKRPNALSSKILVELTNQLSTIRQAEAKSFLQMVEKLNPESDPENWKKLTDLCIRCANSVSPVIWKVNAGDAQKDFFAGKWAGDGPSRLFVTQLVSSLIYAQEQCATFKETIEYLKDDGLTVDNEIQELKRNLASAQAELDHSRALRRESSGGPEIRDEVENAESVAQDLAMSLSNKLNEKELIIVDLEMQVAEKDDELEKMSQAMTHLNARLKFYEVLHQNKGGGSHPPSIDGSSEESIYGNSIGRSSPSRPRSPSKSYPGSPIRERTPIRSIMKSHKSQRSTTPIQRTMRQAHNAEAETINRNLQVMPNSRPPSSPRVSIQDAVNE